MGMSSKSLFIMGVACFGASAVMAVVYSLRYWLPVPLHYDWTCYVSLTHLLPGDTCELLEQVASMITWIAIPCGIVGLTLIGRFRARVWPLIQRICFWGVVATFIVGTAINLGYTLFPRDGSAVLVSTLMLYAPVAILLGIIIYYGMFRRGRGSDA